MVNNGNELLAGGGYLPDNDDSNDLKGYDKDIQI